MRSAQLWELGASEGVRSFALHDCERKELDSKKGTCQGVTEGPHIRHSVFCATRSARNDTESVR
jgi:hypothetical protein